MVFIDVPFGGEPFFGIHCAEGTGLGTRQVEPAPEPCGWPGPSQGEAVDGRAFRMRTVSSWFLARGQICQSARVSVLHPLQVFASQLQGPLGALCSSLWPNISTLPTFARLLVRQNSLEEDWKDVAVLAASRMPLGHLVHFPETGDLGPPLTYCPTSGRWLSLLGLSPSIFSAA